MSDSHDLHVLHDLIAALHATPGAPDEAAFELEKEAYRHGATDADGGSPSVLQTARDALGALIGHPSAAPAARDGGGDLQGLEALMARMEAAKGDDRLSGPARDAVIRAFDPVKAARDAALQRAPD